MTESRFPTEVELAFELMPCNAQRTTYGPQDPAHPGAAHACSYFQKWGTYHSYDYEKDGPPPGRSLVQRRKYVGRARLVPEMLSGCRKAPIMAVGINPNVPAFWPATRNAIMPLFDDTRQYAHYFRYRGVARLAVPMAEYRKLGGGGADDTPFGGAALAVPRDADGFRTVPVEPQDVAMYEGYQSLLDDLAKAMKWPKHALSVGEDVSYGNMVACPSAKWTTAADPKDPSLPPMSAAEQTGIVAECFHRRRYFLRQLFQSLPSVLMVFSQSTADAFLGEMQGRFSKGHPKPGDMIDELLDREVRIRYGKTRKGDELDARVIFSPHITGDPKHFGAARDRVLAQLVAEATAGKITLNRRTGHLARPKGSCVFCPMLEIGPCDYAAELVPLSEVAAADAESTVPQLVMEKRASRSLLDNFLAAGKRAAAEPAEEAWRRAGSRE